MNLFRDIYHFIKEKDIRLETGSDHTNYDRRYDKRERVFYFHKYLTKPVVFAGFAVLIALFFMLAFNLLTNSLASIFQSKDMSIIGSMLHFEGKYIGVYLGSLILGIILALILYLQIYFSYRNLNVGQKGSNRFTTRQELAEQYKLVPEKTERFPGGGGVPVARCEDGIYIDDSPANNLIIGITRSGKGEMLVFPLIDIYSRAEKQASMIITDPKLELAAASMDTLKKRGYEVHVLNLINPLESMGFNPLTAIIREYKAKNYGAAELLCSTYCYSIFNGPEVSGDNEYWANNSTALLSALILATCEDNIKADELMNERRKKAVEEANRKAREDAMRRLDEETAALYSLKDAIEELLKADPTQNIFDLCHQLFDCEDEEQLDRIRKARQLPELKYDKTEFVPVYENEKNINMYSIINTFATLSSKKRKSGRNELDEYFESRPEGDRARLKYSNIGPTGENTKGSIYSNTSSKLQVFLLESIAKMTAKSSVDMNSVGFGDKPIALFIGIPDYDRSNHFIASVFIKQLYFTLAKSATNTVSGKCDREVIFILDEFGNLPAIDDMSNIITVCLGRNIRFNLIIQDYGQLDKLYGESAATIRGNCANQIYIMTNDKTTAEEYSSLVGTETEVHVSRQGGLIGLSKTYTESLEERPLITPDELRNLQEGEMIVVRAIKRKDLQGNHIRSYPIASMGSDRMKYRYQYLLEDFPTRNLSDIEDLERVDNMNLEKITWSAENYLLKKAVYDKKIANTQMVTMDGEIVEIPGIMEPSERLELDRIFSLPPLQLVKYKAELEPNMTLGQVAKIAETFMEQGNKKKAADILTLVDTVLERNRVKVQKLQVKPPKQQISYQDDMIAKIFSNGE